MVQRTRKRFDYGRLLEGMLDRVDGNQEELARRIGVSQPTVSRWKSGADEPRKMNHDRIIEQARELGVINLPDDFIEPPVPTVGYIGAGAEVHFSTGEQDLLGEGPMPPKGNHDLMVAVVVRGDSMVGTAEDGWLIYYQNRRDPPTEDLFGRLCVVGLPDNRILLKKLYAGSTGGVFTLVSYNAAPMIDERVEWAAPVAWIEPK